MLAGLGGVRASIHWGSLKMAELKEGAGSVSQEEAC